MEDVQNVEVTEDTTPKEVLAAGGVSRSRRGPGTNRYGHRRSPTTGHRVRRNKTPEPNFVPPEKEEGEKKPKKEVKRSLSTPGEARDAGFRRISSSSQEEEEERRPRRVSKSKFEATKTKLAESAKRWSGVSLTSSDVKNEKKHSSEVKSGEKTKKPALRTRSKSRGGDEKDEDAGAWWKSWPSFTQRIRGKSLERELVGDKPAPVPPRRNRSLERPPVLKEKEKRKKEEPPVAKKRSKSKTRTITDEDRLPSVEYSSDEFWKSESSGGVRKRRVERATEKEEPLALTYEPLRDTRRNSLKQIVPIEVDIITYSHDEAESKDDPKEKVSVKQIFREILTEWRKFVKDHPRELIRIKRSLNHCLACFLLLVIYCGSGAFIFRFTEGAFENFYKCGVKRVKRDFVDSLWTASHHLREEDWKSQARTKLMEFEEQLHTAHEAGMTSYSGLKAWSFLNAFIYCLTVVTTIGYGHISPSTTTGRAITIIYAIIGIPMFLIVLADFGKLFTRGIKFIWAFVRRVYYTGSCKKVRRTVPMQEVMKGVQMVYDIATFRRPSQLPPGVTLDDIPPPPPPPPFMTARTYTPGDPPGTPALSTFAIDDEFNLPISVAIFILLVYIFCGATVFYVWESWGFFESFYFVFISMSTIGFGDFVPQNQMYMMASIVYLVFGLALTSMCINVVQEKLSDSFRQASAKIGATIGLRVAEEDGTITPVAPAPVEIAEVHHAQNGANHAQKPTPTPSAS